MLSNMRYLLLDTCGETASLALAESGHVLRVRMFAERTASASLVALVTAEEKVLSGVGGAVFTLVQISAIDALPLAMAKFATGVDDIATADVNYVREGQELYSRASRA